MATSPNPLRVDLRRQIDKLLALHPKFAFPSVLTSISNTSSSATATKDILDALSRALAFPALTYDVAALFQPILMDLCARWLVLPDLEEHRVFEAFAALMRHHKPIFP